MNSRLIASLLLGSALIYQKNLLNQDPLNECAAANSEPQMTVC